MRGKAAVIIFALFSMGITPAYAGKRGDMYPSGGRPQDHPRVCGEKVSVELSADTYEGSPPRMRGKADKRVLVFLHYGITPAYAGKSRLLHFFGWCDIGSPPRMRGKACIAL